MNHMQFPSNTTSILPQLSGKPAPVSINSTDVSCSHLQSLPNDLLMDFNSSCFLLTP